MIKFGKKKKRAEFEFYWYHLDTAGQTWLHVHEDFGDMMPIYKQYKTLMLNKQGSSIKMMSKTAARRVTQSDLTGNRLYCVHTNDPFIGGTYLTAEAFQYDGDVNQQSRSHIDR